MAKINHEEYEILKSLDEKWKWIARDEYRNSLWVYVDKPDKSRNEWTVRSYQLEVLHEYENLFQFIQWFDSEPYSIAELIEEYEDSKEYKDSLVIEYFMDKANESEEAEVRKEKIINGLRTLRGELANNYKDNQRIGFIAGVNRAIEFIHSTDEPEVLLPEVNLDVILDDLKEYVKEQQSLSNNVGMAHTSAGNDTHYRQYEFVLECIGEYEPSEELKELVPKQEEVEEGRVRLIVGFDGGTESYYATDIGDALDFLTDYDARFIVSKEPMIPKFVAKWISIHHEQFDLYPALKRLENNALSWEDVYEWYRRNTHTFVNAYLTGKYEVEEEQKYYVYLGDGQYLVSEDELKEHYAKIRHEEDIGFSNYVLTFTEQEIKDYDPRYWPFAEKVEELEE